MFSLYKMEASPWVALRSAVGTKIMMTIFVNDSLFSASILAISASSPAVFYDVSDLLCVFFDVVILALSSIF